MKGAQKAKMYNAQTVLCIDNKFFLLLMNLNLKIFKTVWDWIRYDRVDEAAASKEDPFIKRKT